jgi:uncharacterized protein
MGEIKSPWCRNWKLWAGLSGIAGALAVFSWLNSSFPRLALFWLFGLALGFVLQRSRVCFVSAVSNCVLFRDTRLLEGILGGLFIATAGFAFIMYRLVPDPSSGAIPLAAIISPFGWHLALGGVMFGFGMLLAGGCIVGNLYRIGEGGLPALTAFLGVLLGMGALQFTWPWWRGYIGSLPHIWLPAEIGWPGAVALTLAVILLLFIVVRAMRVKNPPSPGSTPVSLAGIFTRTRGALLGRAWPLALGGIVLALINVLMFAVVDRPWTVTGELMSWSQGLFNLIRLPPPPFDAVPGT